MPAVEQLQYFHSSATTAEFPYSIAASRKKTSDKAVDIEAPKVHCRKVTN
jgi:hypothetical protein